MSPTRLGNERTEQMGPKQISQNWFNTTVHYLDPPPNSSFPSGAVCSLLPGGQSAPWRPGCGLQESTRATGWGPCSPASLLVSHLTQRKAQGREDLRGAEHNILIPSTGTSYSLTNRVLSPHQIFTDFQAPSFC